MKTGHRRSSPKRITWLLAALSPLCCGGSHKTASKSPPIPPCHEQGVGVWTRVASLGQSRFMPAAAVLRDGRVLVSGGQAARVPFDAPPLNSAEIYVPGRDAWEPTGSMGEGRVGHQLVALPDGRVAAFGGGSSSVEVYTPATGTWAPLAWAPTFRAGAAILPAPGGRVAVVGGDEVMRPGALEEYLRPTTMTALLDPARGTWEDGPAIPVSRDIAIGAATDNGSLVVFGGHYYRAPWFKWELFGDRPGPISRMTPGIGWWKPGTREWTLVSWPRAYSGKGGAAAPLSSHEVLILAAQGDELGNRAAAVFDTATGRWTRTPPMSIERVNAIAVAWRPGCVLVVGGSTPSAPMELYSSQQRAWQQLPAPPLGAARIAVRLSDEAVLLLGDDDHPQDAYRYTAVPGSASPHAARTSSPRSSRSDVR
ncbi:MAG: hypothetical protein HY898_06845 [Deltaproteobacteria bacterium]|nr:hypothetical protein [Deltaproteobacteria bacterium]